MDKSKIVGKSILAAQCEEDLGALVDHWLNISQQCDDTKRGVLSTILAGFKKVLGQFMDLVDQWLLVSLHLVSLCSWSIILRKECWIRWARDLIQQSTAYTATKKPNEILVSISRRIASRSWRVKFHHVLHWLNHPNYFKRNTLESCDDDGYLL